MYIIIAILRAYKGKQETDAWMCGDAVWEEMWGVVENMSGLLLSQWSHVFTLWLSGHALVRRAFHHLLREHTDVQLQAGQGIRWRAKVKYFIFISSLCGCLCETDCEWGCLCVLAEVSAWTQTCSPAWDSPMMKRSPGPSAARIKERLKSITHECRRKPVGVWECVLSWVISFGKIQWEMIKTRSGGKSLLNISKIDTNSTTRASRFLQF